MQEHQIFILSLILTAGIIIGVILLFFKKNAGSKLIRGGLALIFIGVMSSVIFGKSFMEVVLLIDVSGFGRAYIAGAMFLVAGVINIIFSSQEK